MEESKVLKSIVLQNLKDSVDEFLKKYKPDVTIDPSKVKIEYSRNEKFGDYSTAFLLENKSGLGNPIENSKLLLEILNSKNKFFSEITFSNPGFINFRVSHDSLKEYIKTSIIDEKNRFPIIEKKEKIIFEFVSANPTGPLNIVSARAAATGDSICNLLQAIGHEVYREFYVNDYGNQVFLLGVSCLIRLREMKGEEVKYQEKDDTSEINSLIESNTLPYEAYRGDYIKDISEKIYSNPEWKEKIDSLLSQKDYLTLSELLSLEAIKTNLSSQKRDLENFSVKFDNYFSERTLHESNKVLKVLDKLKAANDINEEDGKYIFLSTKYGDDKDRVVVREDGRPTYLLADIAYHNDKMERGFDKMINIWGPDHHGYIARLAGSIKSLGYQEDSFKVIIAQQVNLLSSGEKIVMSKRMGKFKTMDELMNYLGEKSKDIARYFFVMRALETPLDFDLDLAKEESDKNPVFYAQYAHARISSIFREVDVKPDFDSFSKLELTEERERLAFWIARFNEEVLDAGNTMEPHRLTTYLQNLCKVFSRFYIAKGNKIKDCDEETKKGLAYLSLAAQNCIKESLHLLGVEAPDLMEKTE